MLLPLPRHSDWTYYFALSSSRISLPRYGCRVGLRIDLFEVCSVFTHVAACTLALSPYIVTRFTQRLQPFRCLHSCSGCFRLEQFAGWGFHPLEKRRLITAHAISGQCNHPSKARPMIPTGIGGEFGSRRRRTEFDLTNREMRIQPLLGVVLDPVFGSGSMGTMGRI